MPRWPIARSITVPPNKCEAERGEYGVIERDRTFEVGHAERKMAKHEASLAEIVGPSTDGCRTHSPNADFMNSVPAYAPG
jgi:hypothetical protein